MGELEKTEKELILLLYKGNIIEEDECLELLARSGRKAEKRDKEEQTEAHQEKTPEGPFARWAQERERAPEGPLAHWIDDADCYICSNCGAEAGQKTKVCPNCLMRMK